MINSHYDRPDFDVTARRGGVVAAVLYVVVVALSMWLVQCSVSEELEDLDMEQGSIVISFGESEQEGSGTIESEESIPEPLPIPEPTPEPTPEPMPTAEESEVEQPEPEEPEEQPEEEIVPPREVNKRALFPGTTQPEAEQTKSEGEELDKESIKGSQSGTSEAAAELGSGLSGNFNLAGRSLVGKLPVPDYEEQLEGRVVIVIYVDGGGRVISANYTPTGSTTNNSLLVAAAREAALRAQFTASDTFEQSGTITYIFKLN